MILNETKLSKIDFPGGKVKYAEEILQSKQTFIVCKEQGAKENKPKNPSSHQVCRVWMFQNSQTELAVAAHKVIQEWNIIWC